MENEVYDGLPSKKRKKRGEPRIDLSDQIVLEWVETVYQNHPEVFLPAAIKEFIKYCHVKFYNDELNLLVDNLQLIPNRPFLTGKNLTKNDWDAWFLYYCIMQAAHYTITPKDIETMTGRDATRVNSAFKAVQRRIEKIREHKPTD